MKLAALLCWWNEDPAWLHDVIQALPLAGVTQLVACDGAYQNFPAGTPASPHEQAEAIMTAAHDAGIPCDLYQPHALWANEPAKRTHSFRLADAIRPDWLLVIDADEVILEAPADLHDRLQASDADYAEVCSLDAPSSVLAAGFLDSETAIPNVMLSRVVTPRRCLFRWTPGITVGPRHFDYVTRDGRNLWGTRPGQPLQIRQMVIDHRNEHRERGRQELARAYWKYVRSEIGDEPVPPPIGQNGHDPERARLLNERLAEHLEAAA